MIQMTFPQYCRHECTIDGRCVRMRPGACELLSVLLMSHPDHFINIGELIEANWHPDLEPDWAAAIVWRRIHTLRHECGIIIENDWGHGWRIPRHAREAEPMRMAA